MWDLIVSVPDHCLSFYYREKNLKFFFYILVAVSTASRQF